MLQDKLTFFGGLDNTGGVHVLFGTGQKRALLFDFGIPHNGLFHPAHVTWSFPVMPTRNREVRQYLLGKMAPPILDLYVPEQVTGLNQEVLNRIWDGRVFPRYELVEVFFGHNHQDHMALVPFARQGLPIYMSQDCYALYRGLVESGHYMDTSAHLIPCEDLSIVDFGDFSVQLIEMDHNSLGASAILIESKYSKIAVTGDWRRHGRHPDRIDRFIDICRNKRVDVLITEATKAPPEMSDDVPYPINEARFLEDYSALLKQAEGLVYLQIAPRDLERMADMMDIAVQMGKTVVMDHSFAKIWHTAIREGVNVLKGHPALDINFCMVDVSLTDRSDLPYEKITLDTIAKNQESIVYFFKYPDLAYLIEIEAQGSRPSCSHFIQADYGVDIESPEYERFFQAYGIQGHKMGNGGHAHHHEVSDLIERIAPKAVVPLHSRFPRNIDTRGIAAYYPERGESISVSELISSATKRGNE